MAVTLEKFLETINPEYRYLLWQIDLAVKKIKQEQEEERE